MNKRLKLYDEELRIYISKKDRNKFRKIAYRNKKTMSEYARLLIKHAIALDELENNLDKMSFTGEWQYGKFAIDNVYADYE